MEDLPAEWVLAFERLTRWPLRIDCRESFDTTHADQIDGALDVAFELLGIAGARAGTDHDDALAELRITQRKVQHDIATHREAHEVRSFEVEVLDQGEQVLDEQVARVRV